MRMPRLSDYTSAREFFRAVRDASIEAERTRITLLRMESAEGVRAQGYEPRATGCGNRDAMAKTDSRIDYEERMRERIESDYALIDLACRVLYGDESGKGGVDALMGSAVADCLSFRYVDARTWPEVSSLVGYSPAECRRKCMEGLDAVDAYGLELCARGEGFAQD